METKKIVIILLIIACIVATVLILKVLQIRSQSLFEERIAELKDAGFGVYVSDESSKFFRSWYEITFTEITDWNDFKQRVQDIFRSEGGVCVNAYEGDRTFLVPWNTYEYYYYQSPLF